MKFMDGIYIYHIYVFVKKKVKIGQISFASMYT